MMPMMTSTAAIVVRFSTTQDVRQDEEGDVRASRPAGKHGLAGVSARDAALHHMHLHCQAGQVAASFQCEGSTSWSAGANR